MGQNSKIEWTHHTMNPWRGCTKVSAGCAHCYAEKQAKRNPGVLGVWGDNGTDVFEDRPELAEPRYHLFDLIDTTPNLDWLLLTKRPQNIRQMWPGGCFTDEGRTIRLKHRSNVWLGTSVENQAAADERIPHLLACRNLAPVLFLSVEPLLGPVDLGLTRAPTDEDYDRRNTSDGPIDLVVTTRGTGISWVIVGGESGPNARPMHPAWARSIRDQCQAAGVPFFFKQGSQANWPNFKDFDSFPDDLKIREFPKPHRAGTRRGL